MGILWRYLIAILAVHFLVVVASANETVRVRLGEDKQRVLIHGYDLNISKLYRCKGYCSFEILQQASGQFLIRSLTHNFSYKTSTPIQLNGRELRIGSSLVPENLLIKSVGKRITTIGTESIEEYLLGVVSSEMPATWPLETLKAQALAAKSYMLAVKEERKDFDFDVESSVLDQVFKKQSNSNLKLKNAWRAVQATRGKKLVNSHGSVLKAFYHADCGGETINASEVWSDSENVGTAKDKSCALRSRSRWTLQVMKNDLLNKLGKNLKLDFDYFPEFEWFAQSKVSLHKEVGFKVGEQSYAINGNQLRAWLGFDKLKSTKFQAVDLGDRIEFKGVGYGHGVGLCQWGSRDLAQQGLKHEQILKHYYPLAQIKRYN